MRKVFIFLILSIFTINITAQEIKDSSDSNEITDKEIQWYKSYEGYIGASSNFSKGLYFTSFEVVPIGFYLTKYLYIGLGISKPFYSINKDLFRGTPISHYYPEGYGHTHTIDAYSYEISALDFFINGKYYFKNYCAISPFIGAKAGLALSGYSFIIKENFIGELDFGVTFYNKKKTLGITAYLGLNIRGLYLKYNYNPVYINDYIGLCWRDIYRDSEFIYPIAFKLGINLEFGTGLRTSKAIKSEK